MARSGQRASRRQACRAALGVALASLGATALAGCGGARATTPSGATRRTPTPPPTRHEARFYRRLEGGAVQCQVCWRGCVVAEGELGFCGNKKNVGGSYYSLVYGRPGAVQIDPIEKEPAFHMLPGSTILCIGTAGCNNRCRFCQNWHLSQQSLWQVPDLGHSAEEIVAMALEAGCRAVSFTYNEPTVFYEFMIDIASRAREAGLGALCHTNGGMSREPMLALLEVMDAVTVDLKAFTEAFYREVSSSRLAPVLQTLETVRASGRHLEIVNLVIPTLNDDPADIRRMCAWIKAHLGQDVPLHFTRFFPAYRLQRLPPTPVATLELAAQIAAEEGLQYVYIGNLPGHRQNSTFCPGCGETLIQRLHFAVLEVRLEEGRCLGCGHQVPGIWRDPRRAQQTG